MRLTDKRLLAVLSELKGVKSIADIGTDHGKLPVYAISEGIVERAIATDISAASLQKAYNLAKSCGIDVITRVGDGLDIVEPSEVECVVIAGMGGHEIVKIISNRIKDFEKYILVPHKKAHIVRAFLKENNVGISMDRIVKDGKFFYHIIACDIHNKWNIAHNIYIGSDNSIDNDDFCEYHQYRLDVLEKLIAKSKDDKQAFLEEKKELVKWNL